MLPKGMQENLVRARVIDEVAEEHVMASVVKSADGYMPTYKEALKCPDWPKWEEAINSKLNSLKANNTWELVKCPPNVNMVDSKWVLKIKKNAAGEVKKYKARLIARGFMQIYGTNYYETYAPVARLTSF